jgi:hypothetical protein
MSKHAKSGFQGDGKSETSMEVSPLCVLKTRGKVEMGRGRTGVVCQEPKRPLVTANQLSFD